MTCNQPEQHDQTGTSETAACRLTMFQADRGKRAIDDIGGPDVAPGFCREVVNCKSLSRSLLRKLKAAAFFAQNASSKKSKAFSARSFVAVSQISWSIRFIWGHSSALVENSSCFVNRAFAALVSPERPSSVPPRSPELCRRSPVQEHVSRLWI